MDRTVRRLLNSSKDPNRQETNNKIERGREEEESRQGVGVLGMLWGVVVPYGQNETDSKIVTTSGTPSGMPIFSTSLLHQCLFQYKELSVLTN